MHKFDFQRIRRTPESVLAVLNDPNTAVAVYKHLEYINGGSLPSTGLIAGQSVSSAIDYQLGLRDESAIVIKDIDHFFTPTWDDVFDHAPVRDNHLVQVLARKLLDDFGCDFLAKGTESWVTPCESIADKVYEDLQPMMVHHSTPAPFVNLLRAVKQHAPAYWMDIITAGEKWYSRYDRFQKGISFHLHQWSRITHPVVKQAWQNLATYIKEAHALAVSESRPYCTPSSWFEVLKSRDTTEVELACDLVWDYHTSQEYGGRRSVLFRNNILAGNVKSEYAVIGVGESREAVQPVMTSTLRLQSENFGTDYHYREGSLDQIHVASIPNGSTYFQSKGLGYSFGVIAGFDINAVQVGLDVDTMRLVFTKAYVSYLCTRQLAITHEHSPIQSLGRMIEKGNSLAAFVNKARAARHIEIVMAKRVLMEFDKEQPTAHSVAKLQQLYDHIRAQPDSIRRTESSSKFTPVLLAESSAHRLMALPEVESAFTMEPVSGRLPAYVLVPRKADVWQLPIRLSPPLAQTNLAIQYSEVNARWKGRIDTYIRQATPVLWYSKIAPFMTAIRDNLEQRTLTPFQCQWLDNKEWQPLIKQLTEHQELLLHVDAISEEYLEMLKRSFQFVDKKKKPIKDWSAQIEWIRNQDAGLTFSEHMKNPQRLNLVHQWEETAKYNLMLTLTASRISVFSVFSAKHRTGYGEILLAKYGLTRLGNHTLVESAQATHDRELVGQAAETTLIQFMQQLKPAYTANEVANVSFTLIQQVEQLTAKYDRIVFEHDDTEGNHHVVDVIQLMTELVQGFAQYHVTAAHEYISKSRQHLYETQGEAMTRDDLRTYAYLDEEIILPAPPLMSTIKEYTAWFFAFQTAAYRHVVPLYFLTSLFKGNTVQIARVEPLPLAPVLEQIKQQLPTYVERFECAELLSSVALALEGNQQGHCVGSYFPSVDSNTSRILALRMETHGQVYRATAEWRNSDGAIVCNQLQAKGNLTPNPLLTTLHNQILNLANATFTWPASQSTTDPVPVMNANQRYEELFGGEFAAF